MRSLRTASGFPASGWLNRQHSIRQADGFLRAAGLEKIRGKTLGFGPFRFFNFRLHPDAWGIKLHEVLQRWADRGIPLIRSMGGQYMILARKPLDSRRASCTSATIGSKLVGASSEPREAA